jgi:hypothetical protein
MVEGSSPSCSLYKNDSIIIIDAREPSISNISINNSTDLFIIVTCSSIKLFSPINIGPASAIILTFG